MCLDRFDQFIVPSNSLWVLMATSSNTNGHCGSLRQSRCGWLCLCLAFIIPSSGCSRSGAALSSIKTLGRSEMYGTWGIVCHSEHVEGLFLATSVDNVSSSATSTLANPAVHVFPIASGMRSQGVLVFLVYHKVAKSAHKSNSWLNSSCPLVKVTCDRLPQAQE